MRSVSWDCQCELSSCRLWIISSRRSHETVDASSVRPRGNAAPRDDNHPSSVPVPVMRVVNVRVVMSQRFMTMPVSMRRLRELLGRVLVQMVLVVGVLVRVLQSLMLMQMFMPIRREQERPRGHGRERKQAPTPKGFAQEDQGEDRGEARREREEHPGLDHSELTEPSYE